MKLVTHNLGGNLHSAATWINDYNLADKVLAMDCINGHNTVVVFRVKDDAFDLRKWCAKHATRARKRLQERERQNAMRY